MSKYVIVRKSAATGREMFLTESRTAGVSFEAPGSSRVGVGVDNLKIWKTEAGAQRWMAQRPGFASRYADAGMPVMVREVCQ
jgi:hypothetical protein